MSQHFDTIPMRQALVSIARDFHARGWMPGTAGNLSARDPHNPASFWITASGHPKGQLDTNDFVRVEVDSGVTLEVLSEGAKPSAETSIHQVIYQAFPTAAACLHVHTVDACLAAHELPTNALEITLPPLEVIKGLGVWRQDPRVSLPLFANWLDVPRIAQEIAERFGQVPPILPALMIRDHGITVWGETLQQAYDRVEIVEFIMSFIARQRTR